MQRCSMHWTQYIDVRPVTLEEQLDDLIQSELNSYVKGSHAGLHCQLIGV